MFEFKLLNKSKRSKARVGIFKTPHGEITTPVFMPVGTVGAVKTMTPEDLESAGAEIILANTYHLHLRPGEKLIKKAGGLHRFIGWNKPILTDSGGFQVFSLSEAGLKRREVTRVKPARISERGVEFFSHLDGSRHFMAPEDSVRIQEDLGADIIMAFDYCPPANSSESEVKRAVSVTHNWLERCMKAQKRKDQLLVPICQGGVYKDLRVLSAEAIKSFGQKTNAIGGVSVGEKKEKIYEVADWCTDILPEGAARYLMGIGYPEDIAEVIRRGIDMFDCVLPTRLARHGVIWRKSKISGKKIEGVGYRYEQIDLTKPEYKKDFDVLDKSCRCKACKWGLSRSYLRHLVLEKEPLGIHLMSYHNLVFVFDLVSDLRESIKKGTF